MTTSFPSVRNVPLGAPHHDEQHAEQSAWNGVVEGAIHTLESSGVTNDASSLTTGTLDMARLPVGSIIVVDKTKNGGSWPAARPTARTDVTVIWVGDTDPSTKAINGDEWDQVA